MEIEEQDAGRVSEELQRQEEELSDIGEETMMEHILAREQVVVDGELLTYDEAATSTEPRRPQEQQTVESITTAGNGAQDEEQQTPVRITTAGGDAQDDFDINLILQEGAQLSANATNARQIINIDDVIDAALNGDNANDNDEIMEEAGATANTLGARQQAPEPAQQISPTPAAGNTDRNGFTIAEVRPERSQQQAFTSVTPDSKEEWVRRPYQGTMMAVWNPTKFPKPHVPGQEVPERTLRFTIRPTPRGRLDEVQRAINAHLCREIEEGIETATNTPSFRDDQNRIMFPATTVFWRNNQLQADVVAGTMEQAATLVEVCKEMHVSALLLSGVQELVLRQVGHGYCHERAFVTFDMVPHLSQNQQTDEVPYSKYETAIGHLLASYPMLSLLGVWQKTTVWTTNYETPKAVVRVTVQRPPTLMRYDLPGFLSDKGVVTATTRSDLIAGATRFKLIYDGRIEYCARCIVEEHESKDCPKIVCHRCGVNGHMQFKCPTQMIQNNRSQATNEPENDADRRQTRTQERSRPYPDRRGSWRGARRGRGGRQPRASIQQQPRASIQHEVRVTTRIDPRTDPRYAAFRHS